MRVEDQLSNPNFMIRRIEGDIHWLQTHHHRRPVMSISPVYAIKGDHVRDHDVSLDTINEALDAVDRFQRQPGPDGLLGTLPVNIELTVDDALRALDLSVGYSRNDEDRCARHSITKHHKRGATQCIDIRGETLIVDKAKFAERTTLPLKSSGSIEYKVFLYHQVPELARPDNRPYRSVLVMIAGEQHSKPPAADSLAHCWSDLEGRGKSDLDNGIGPLVAPGIVDGWQLRAHPEFTRLLGLLRFTSSNLVWAGEEGLEITY